MVVLVVVVAAAVVVAVAVVTIISAAATTIVIIKIKWMDGWTDDIFSGGRIDHGHHDGSAKKALEDTLAFEEAIQRALAMTIEEDTLIIITADHSHTLTLGTYPARGSNILGNRFCFTPDTYKVINHRF